jgi:hypothetical protein
MATSKEQHDARQHAVNTGSVQRGPAKAGEQGRATSPGAAAESVLGEPAEVAGGSEGERTASRPADPDVPSSDEP